MDIEFHLGKAMVALAGDGISFRESLESATGPHGYDPDLLYVECRLCGKPVLWEKGKTGLLVSASGLDTSMLDEQCMLLSDGCPNCRPGTGEFHLQVVRVTSLTPQDLLLLTDSRGNA